MRTRKQLDQALDEISGTRDYTLQRMLVAVLRGDESQRADVERTLDELDAETARRAE